MGFNSNEYSGIDCCRFCTDRVSGCHGSCKEYREQREKMLKKKADMRKEKDLQKGINDIRIHNRCSFYYS